MDANPNTTTFQLNFKAIAVICLIVSVFATMMTGILMVRLMLEDFFFLFPHVQFATGYFFLALFTGAGAYFAWARHRRDKKAAKSAAKDPLAQK